MTLEQFDVTHNQIQGSIPSSWTMQASGTLAKTLQTLMLNNNQLVGQLPELGGMPALSCWSVANNWLMCGPLPLSGVCGITNNTRIGEWPTGCRLTDTEG